MQWTPYTKYTNWLNPLEYPDPSEMDANLSRINYEVVNNIQWGNDALGNSPPYNFEGFTRSTDTPYNLAINFLRYYERPYEYNQPIRGQQAEYWYEYLQNISPEPPEPPVVIFKKKKFKWVLYAQKLRNKNLK